MRYKYKLYVCRELITNKQIKMKKVLLVLGLGLVMMTCTNEGFPFNDCILAVESFSSVLSETNQEAMYFVDVVDSEGAVSTAEVSEYTWNSLKEEIKENGFACFTSF